MNRQPVRTCAPLVLALLLSAAADANVNFYSGEKIVAFCTADTTSAPERLTEFGVCRGFLAAVVDTYTTVEDWENLKRRYLCIPPGTPVATLRQVFLDYMQVHIEDWQKAASSLALNAFNAKWPCPAD